MLCKRFFENKNIFFKIFVCYFSTFALFLVALLPIIGFKINQNEVCFNGFNLIFKKGFFFDVKFELKQIGFPVFLKLTVFLNLLFLIFAVVFFVFKKYSAAAAFYFFSFFSFLFFMLSLNMVKKNILNLNVSSNKLIVKIFWPYLLTILIELFLSICCLLKKGKEDLVKAVFFCCSLISILIVVLLLIYFLVFGSPAIFKIGFFKFIFGSLWVPQYNQFEIKNLILASIFSTAGAIFLAAPLGILAATFLSEIANKKLVLILNPIVEVLAAIPSVIYGFFGMTVIVPLVKKIAKNNLAGDSLLSVILVLFIMILPTIISTSFVSLKAVPKKFKEASLNLGATKVQTIFKVTLKACKSGIFAGINLAVSKAIGETMAVMMVAGNVVNPPKLLNPVKLLTTGIALDMAYASGLFRQVLFAIGVVLFFLISLINLTFNKISKNIFN